MGAGRWDFSKSTWKRNSQPRWQELHALLTPRTPFSAPTALSAPQNKEAYEAVLCPAAVPQLLFLLLEPTAEEGLEGAAAVPAPPSAQPSLPLSPLEAVCTGSQTSSLVSHTLGMMGEWWLSPVLHWEAAWVWAPSSAWLPSGGEGGRSLLPGWDWSLLSPSCPTPWTTCCVAQGQLLGRNLSDQQT